MKKHVLVGLTLMLICFIAGGVYIITSIQEVTNKLERVISFHQVEFLRQNLEHHIKAVQSDLLLQGSPHARDTESTISLIEAMEGSATTCLNCHHTEQIKNRLEALNQNVKQYMHLLSRTMTIRASNELLENNRRTALAFGDNLLKEVKMLSVASAVKISERITKIHTDITAAKHILITSVVLGPIAILLITFLFLKRFTGSVDTLVEAAQTLEHGDLDYRVSDASLKDEFRTLANSFNGMAASLQEEQQRYKSVYELYQTLFETAGDAIMITSLEENDLGEIFSANPAACELYGYHIEELQGMNVTKLVPDDRKLIFRDRIRTVLAGGWTHQRTRRQRKDGQLIDVDLSMGLLQMDGQKFMLTFCRDITEQLHAEEEMQRANQMALCGQMAAGLAHEIKNPLAGVKVSLDVLADDLDLQPEDKELFARITNEINRMEKLLKNMLNYARPPQPQFDLVDMNQLLDNSLKNTAVTVTGRSDLVIDFREDFMADLPRVEADSAQIQQIFLNILLNAVDAIEAVDAGGTITTRTSMTGEDCIRIEISDTGKGMPDTALKKIFNPFFTTKTKGTGLGLSICKRLVEQHNGNLEVESHIDKGTAFIITLPLTQKHREYMHEQ